jgi:hypothetical protein
MVVALSSVVRIFLQIVDDFTTGLLALKPSGFYSIMGYSSG